MHVDRQQTTARFGFCYILTAAYFVDLPFIQLFKLSAYALDLVLVPYTHPEVRSSNNVGELLSQLSDGR